MKNSKFVFALIFILISYQSIIFTQGIPHTQCKNGLNIPINDLTTTKDSILVNLGGNRYIRDLNIRIDTLIHTWVSDLTISIKKNSITRVLFNEAGGSGDNFIGTIFDDSAIVSINTGTAPFTGSFRPFESLTEYNGSYNPNGYYVLSITDDATSDTGFLRAWCVVVNWGIIDGINGTIEIPNTYRLYQNYPNPFNPVTKIKYGVPKNGYVKLTVYDELGKEVDVVAKGYREANMYEAVFDATNLPSGVYYYKLEAEGFADTKKMVIVK